MSLELEYSSKEDALQKLDATKEQIDEILNDNMNSWFNEVVIPEMKRIATAMNLPKGFVDGINFRKTGKGSGKLGNSWGSEEKPLAKWFNWGTVDHWIQAAIGKVLSWISGAGGGTHASAIFFQSGTEGGNRMYSKGHYVSGLQRTEAMEFGIRQGKKRLISQLPALIEGKLE